MKLTLKHTLAAIILVLSFAAPVAAGPLEDADAAYSRGDYATALRIIRPLAEQDNASAQFRLGVMYGSGDGVPKSDAEQLKWFRRAAYQGDADAQYSLGSMYNLGIGVQQDYAEALKWYRLAADQGRADAQDILGTMYAQGQGVPQDYVRAHMWLNLSAAKGDQDAAKNRDNIAQHMTPAQIAEAQKLAREWKPTKQPPQ
jgi:TPR repeat protein